VSAARRTAIVFAAAALLGCTKSASSGSSEVHYVMGAAGRTERPWVRRIDGDVDKRYVLDVLPGGPQQVILTGLVAGADQGTLIVLDADGRELLRHRAATATHRGHNLLMPAAISGAPIEHRGRRMFAISLGGLWSPYGVEILEVTGEPKLRSRRRFWNAGAVGVPVAKDGLVAFRCLNNSFRDEGKDESTPIAVGVLSLDDAIRDGEVEDAVGPVRGESAGRGYLRYFLLGERDEYGKPSSLEVSIEEGLVKARLESGLTYALDPVRGAAVVTADQSYRDRHAERRRRNESLPDVDAHLAAIRDAVRTFVPERR